MPISLGLQAYRPASWFVTVDTFAAPQCGTFHTHDRQVQLIFSAQTD
jgi:hypothetical protein